MLDGLLGRSGFYSKCKSLIKQTRTRINVAKKKQNATQKFMRKDIADLIANGLENNAYARAEVLITDLILSSCYDFIDQVCEIILKHLPVLHKVRECPEDCREAVASLMFAAARFSDLPELRELRDLFQERYGSSLKYYVSRKLVENATPKPPSMEKKIQLMQEIALEFSIWWDSRPFKERMSKPSATEKHLWNRQQSPGIRHATEKKIWTPFVEQTARNTVKNEVLEKNRSDAYRNKGRDLAVGHQMEKGREGPVRRRDDLKHGELAEDIQVRSMRKKQENATDRPKSDSRNAIPPPYVKPRKSRHKRELRSKHANDVAYADKKDTLCINPGSNTDKSDGVSSTENEDGLGCFTEIYYRDASSGESSPRRRSHRRKHLRSMSTQDDKLNGNVGREEERVFRRVSTRRKHESRKVLQIVFDDEHYKMDKEERMIDRLLLHYSRKPSSFDPGKPSIKPIREVKDESKYPQHKVLDRTKMNEVSTPMTSRSMSFPPRQVNMPEPQKAFARASSFQQRSPAKHVHPKLPDYDDLAARFAALKARKG